jgi:hypothetical protein
LTTITTITAAGTAITLGGVTAGIRITVIPITVGAGAITLGITAASTAGTTLGITAAGTIRTIPGLTAGTTLGIMTITDGDGVAAEAGLIIMQTTAQAGEQITSAIPQEAVHTTGSALPPLPTAAGATRRTLQVHIKGTAMTSAPEALQVTGLSGHPLTAGADHPMATLQTTGPPHTVAAEVHPTTATAPPAAPFPATATAGPYLQAMSVATAAVQATATAGAPAQAIVLPATATAHRPAPEAALHQAATAEA